MGTDPRHAAAVEGSLEIAAERAGDLTPRVYERLFEVHPEMKPLFRRDTDDGVKGEMLARVFEAILDFVGERLYSSHLIRSEIVTHAGYDVPEDIFSTFFGIVADTVREACGDAWTTAMADAWSSVLAEIDGYLAEQKAAVA